jgi:hypothetical protein
VCAAFLVRARPEMHKRLMLLATINLVPAALTRLPLGAARVPVALGLSFGFVVAGPIFDWIRRKRVHPVYIWGGLLMLVSGPLRPIIGNSEAWHSIARLLTR